MTYKKNIVCDLCQHQSKPIQAVLWSDQLYVRLASCSATNLFGVSHNLGLIKRFQDTMMQQETE